MGDQRSLTDVITIFPGRVHLSGGVLVMLNLAEGIAARGVPVDLFLTRPPGELEYLVPASVGVHVGRGSKTRSFTSLVHYLQRRRPRGLISAHPGVNVMSVLARYTARVPTPVVVTIHNNTSARPSSVASVKEVGLTMAMRLTYRRAQSIVAVSGGVADDAARGLRLPRDRIEVIYNATITPRMIEAASEQVGHPWLGNGVPLVLGMGRLTAQKDFATLIRAFALVRRERPAHLLILGEGEDRRQLEQLAESLGLANDVSLPGNVVNPMPYIKAADVVAVSSAWDGLSGVLIEAISVGTPVVSTDCPSGPREVLDGDRLGKLVPVGDYDALARATLDTLAHPPDREPLIERGRYFSADRAAGEYLDLINRL